MIIFQKLWDNHPTITGDDNPCNTNGKSNFPNQCAIKLGVCLAKNGVNTTKIPGVTHCWHQKKSEGHVIRAEELAKGLKRFHLPGVQKVQEVAPESYFRELKGKTGIIFFKDYWQRTINGTQEEFRNRSGDHIDLWNGSRLTDWKTWVRVRLNIIIPGVWSDLRKSKSIWFWRIL